MAALSGLRILDMTQWEAGTSCTQALAWLGADVVKIEPIEGGDPGRTINQGSQGDSDYFLNWNSNKRSVALNLRDPKGRELLLGMVPKFDVFIENYAPGVVEKLNIGYDVIKQLNPQIIYAQIKGYGNSGPYAKYKCFDMVAQAAAGALSITGEADGPPMRPGPTLGDSGSGVQMALAISAAYAQKLRDGIGQHIEISMQEAVTYFMRSMVALGAESGNAVAPRFGNEFDPTVNLFPCKPFGKNDYVYVMCVTEPHWSVLCRAIGQPELIDDPRFQSSEQRKQYPDELREIIGAWTTSKTKHEAMKILNNAGLPASATFDTKDLFNDPHLRERGFIHDFETSGESAKLSLLGWPLRMSESAVDIELAPALGVHTNDILQQELALDEAAITNLRDAGVII